MGFNPITMAVVGAGASLLGSSADRRAAGKQANQANAVYEQRANQQIDMLNQARGLIGPAYQRSGDLRQQALNRSLGLAGQMFMPQMQSMQGGNYAAQQAILGGLPAQRAALLGGRMPAPAQAQMLPFDQSALQGFINPTIPNLRG